MSEAPKPMQGTWKLVSPDGRVWAAETPLRCVSMEQRERVPAHVRLLRILDAASECHDWQPIETAPRQGSFLAADEHGFEVWEAQAYWTAVAADAKSFMPRNEARALTHWHALPTKPQEA